MREEKKYLGINQPIPYKVLEESIYHLLNNKLLTKEELVKLLKEYIHGENRLNKALSHINILFEKNNRIISLLKNNKIGLNYFNLSYNDRTSLLICLVALTFPVTYDLMIMLATGFKVQNKINRNYINHKLSSIYGSNRGIYNAVNALLPMLVEYNLLKMEKSGIYEIETTKNIQNKFVNELYIYTDIKSSGSKSILLDDLQYRPWYLFFEATPFNQKDFVFLKLIESRIGQGYLTTI